MPSEMNQMTPHAQQHDVALLVAALSFEQAERRRV